MRNERGARRTHTSRRAPRKGGFLRSAQATASRPEPTPSPTKRTARRAERTPTRTILGLSTGRALILAMVISALALTLAVPMRTYFSQHAESARLVAERSQLEADLRVLRDKKAQQDDPAYIRAEARTRLRLVEPGETPYIVQLPGAYEASRQPAHEPPKPTGPWYSQLWKSVASPQSAAPPPEPPPPPLPIAPPPPLPTGPPR